MRSASHRERPCRRGVGIGSRRSSVTNPELVRTGRPSRTPNPSRFFQCPSGSGRHLHQRSRRAGLSGGDHTPRGTRRPRGDPCRPVQRSPARDPLSRGRHASGPSPVPDVRSSRSLTAAGSGTMPSAPSWQHGTGASRTRSGGMRERPNRTVSKTVVPSGYRGFESHSLRRPPRHAVAAASGPGERSAMTLTETKARPGRESGTEHVDVLIVGAGISGIGAAHHLREQCPDKPFVMLETMDDLRGHLGRPTGTPGHARTATSTRSATASSPGPARRSRPRDEILDYLGRGHRRGRARRADPLPPHRHRGLVVERRAPLDARGAPRADTGERVRFTAGFLWMCQGYYRHERGLHARVAGLRPLRGHRRAPTAVARGPRPRGQARRRHRLGRDGGDAHPVDRRRTPPT